MLVTATLNLGLAILAEATLSFLGVGMPVNAALARHADPHRQPVPLLRRPGGSWCSRPLQLCLIILSVNLLADWLRDALNPKLR